MTDEATRIGVNGAAGRMGRLTVGLIADSAECSLACALEAPGHPQLGEDAGLVAGTDSLGVLLSRELCGAPAVLIDFSTPEGCLEKAEQCAEDDVAMVVATTGLSEDQKRYLDCEVAMSVPILRSPNMSVGVNLLFEISSRAAATLGTEYDIEIVEAHHRHKKDAPSGTALRMARRICEQLDWDFANVVVYGRHGATGERPMRQLAIHAVRGGDVAGDHTVIFATRGERIELTHRASSPEVFARGAIRAAHFLAGQNPGLYSMDDVLKAVGPS